MKLATLRGHSFLIKASKANWRRKASQKWTQETNLIPPTLTLFLTLQSSIPLPLPHSTQEKERKPRCTSTPYGRGVLLPAPLPPLMISEVPFISHL